MAWVADEAGLRHRDGHVSTAVEDRPLWAPAGRTVCWSRPRGFLWRWAAATTSPSSWPCARQCARSVAGAAGGESAPSGCAPTVAITRQVPPHGTSTRHLPDHRAPRSRLWLRPRVPALGRRAGLRPPSLVPMAAHPLGPSPRDEHRLPPAGLRDPLPAGAQVIVKKVLTP